MTGRVCRDFLPLALLALVLMPAPALAGCDTGENLYHQAMAVSSPGARAALLRASISACPSGLAWIELGRAHLAQGSLSQAEAAFQESLKWTGLPGERAAALTGLGRVYQGMGRDQEALSSYRASLKLRPDPRVEALAHELEARSQSRP